MKKLDCFSNPETGEVRAVLGLREGSFAVVKFFRDDDEVFSVKVWVGDYAKTRSYWNTTHSIKGDKADVFFALAKDHLRRAASLLKEV